MDKNTQVVMFSSKTGEWSTPQDFFDKLNWRFGAYTLDPCANPANTKCPNFFTEAEDGLTKSWEGFNSFINPPYGRGIERWIKKAYDESRHENTSVTMLVPARTDTKYWHSYIMKADEVYFVKGRLKFGDSKNSAPFPSAVIVFDGTNRQQIFGTINK
jgi:phage N-6-adenine-methyltransferase